MKYNLKLILLAALTVFTASTYAQLTPAPSSTQTITQDFGLGKINLTYSRPNVKGRKIFGNVEPYGKVWRTGANSATVIKFSDDVSIEGHKVPAGEYGLFSIPGESEWTIILSKNPKQWGAYTYKEADDYLRFTVKPVKLNETQETFTMQFVNVFPTSAELHLMWEHTALNLHLTTDIDAKVMSRIDSAMKTDKKPYYEAVIYYYNNNKDLKTALPWAEEMGKMPGMPPFVADLWKARVQLKTGDKTGAITTATAGVEAAKKANNDEYTRLNTELIALAKK
ncbi:DUF2911 domain-containing protein [Mucilaginibacter sp.]|uniref:DUF2911 domain-containing protein n=1 Tax=Mucilaginibacter sp. TaxID=1882438 RepID=UPI0025EEFD57|nr:DUF2911 domain-containing protein [Mucilaginibacter sp.]